MMLLLEFLQIITVLCLSVAGAKQPHIIVIVADDLGWNDVGFHGSTQIPTPNIDALAYSGVILNNYYVQPICTPSRGALMTGKYPIHTGLQHGTIGGSHPYGMPLNLPVMPELLGSLGYVTRHIGKWHLGFFHAGFTPIFRGFRSHFGYWTGRIDYYDHTSFENPGWWGYDMRRDMEVAHDAYGKYTTDLFTEEAVHIIREHNETQPLFLYLAHLAVHSANPYDSLQAPSDIVKLFSYIKDEQRRKFAGMLWKLDESVGKVVSALDQQKMLQDSIIIFTSDNGGPAAGFNQNAASNWPLRGVKASMWEGGVRGAGFIWSPQLSSPGRVSHQMLHITDWLPTVLTAAGGNSTSLSKIDGTDMWNELANNLPSRRSEFVVNIDPILDGAAIRVGDWKLIYHPSGYGSEWDGWYGPSGRNETAPQTDLDYILHMVTSSPSAEAVRKIFPNIYHNIRKLRLQAEIHCGPVPNNATKSCDQKTKPCLFYVPLDPCEYTDVSSAHPEKVWILQERLAYYNSTAMPPGNKPWDPAANPKYWGYSWTNWKDYKPPPAALSLQEIPYEVMELNQLNDQVMN